MTMSLVAGLTTLIVGGLLSRWFGLSTPPWIIPGTVTSVVVMVVVYFQTSN
jgi:DNA integrity scanning protein DisA with diadenylate cyclase activity